MKQDREEGDVKERKVETYVTVIQTDGQPGAFFRHDVGWLLVVRWEFRRRSKGRMSISILAMRRAPKVRIM